MSNDIMVVNNEFNDFCSMVVNSDNDRQVLFNAISATPHKLSDYINKVIKVKDVYVETVKVKDRKGEIVDAPRVVLIDVNGEGYGCVSQGVYGALRKLFVVFGVPTWNDPVPVEVKQVQGKDSNRILTLSVKF